MAYIDPGNYSTDVAASATYRFRLLFIVLMSNIFTIFLQSLCIRLGSITSLNLAEAYREFLPKWLNIGLYIMAKGAVGTCASIPVIVINKYLDHYNRYRQGGKNPWEIKLPSY